jgi:hypothetical protein
MKAMGLQTLLLVLAACGAVSFGDPRSVRAADGTEIELRARIHSHNDYQQKHPLTDAMNQRLSSVEADIWIKQGELLVSHLGISFKGSLENLYLKPLQSLVNERGSVYGDGQPFILWIDIKENQTALERELANVLARYPMLTEFTDASVKPGAVTVILTGKVGPKTDYADHTAVRYACRDSKVFDEQDPSGDLRWMWYSLKWSAWMKDYAQLRSVIAQIHVKGRKVRLWDVPTSETIWREALEAGADLVGADDLPRVRKFVDALATE